VHCVHHFKRLSYDNPQLARVYLHAWQATGNEFLRTITEEILDYVIREMTDSAGGFSAQDADPTALRSGDDRSEGEEGKFFVWTPYEIRAVLGSHADDFMAAYGMTRHGNAAAGSTRGFEGKNFHEFVGKMEDWPLSASRAESPRCQGPGSFLDALCSPGFLTSARRS
jgi:uncharacterized protein YyaL (SSP411 family)